MKFFCFVTKVKRNGRYRSIDQLRCTPFPSILRQFSWNFPNSRVDHRQTRPFVERHGTVNEFGAQLKGIFVAVSSSPSSHTCSCVKRCSCLTPLGLGPVAPLILPPPVLWTVDALPPLELDARELATCCGWMCDDACGLRFWSVALVVGSGGRLICGCCSCGCWVFWLYCGCGKCCGSGCCGCPWWGKWCWCCV